MGEVALKKVQKVEDRLSKVMKYSSLMALVMMALVIAFPSTFAQGKAASNAADVIEGVLAVVYLITNIVGIIFVIIGFVKLAIAYANEDGPSQQKAALFVATGLILILIRLVLRQIKFDQWIDTSLS